MSVDDLVEAYLAGQQPTVPAELREEFERAIAGHQALANAIGETVIAPERPVVDRGAPTLPEDYEVVRELGRGGMGVVYLARQRSLGRMVAVKVLRPGEIAFGAFVKRFVEEARHLARLRHPNIVSIHETGQAGDEPYFTMDYVEGESLHSLLKRGPLSPTQAVRILKQAAEGVEHAHAQGIIHRDLKPANILLDKAGRAYVTDFGLARDVTKGSELTGSGDILGTPAYMAPEQALGQKDRIGEATDVHALGVVLYEMLTGEPPYGHGAPAAVLVRLLKEDPAPPRKVNRRVPRDLETICLKAMAKAPEWRYSSVHALIEDLRRYEGGLPIVARGPGLLRPVWRFVRRRAYLIAILTVLTLGYRLGPRLFDKSQQATDDIATKLYRTGDFFGAVKTLRMEYATANAKEREKILDHMVWMSGMIKDSDQAAEAWKSVLELAPDQSFEELDGVVARVLVEDLGHPYARNTTGKARREMVLGAVASKSSLAQRALSRLNLFLAGKAGTEEEREAARADAMDIDDCLHLPAPVAEAFLELLPCGTPKQLAESADDATAWMDARGTAAFALARVLEASGDKVTALVRYRQAYESMRAYSPFYSGPIQTADGPPNGRNGDKLVWKDEDPDCILLRELDAAIRRLDPSEPNHLRGGLVFHLDGEEPPQGISLNASCHSMSSRNPKDPKGGIPTGTADFGADRVARIGIADGRYSGMQYSWGVWDPLHMDNPLAECYAIDMDGMPGEFEVHGNWIDVRPEHLRKLKEVRLLSPSDGAKVDLSQAEFRWAPVKDAFQYVLKLLPLDESSGRVSGDPSIWLDTSATNVRFADLPAKTIQGDLKKFASHSTAVWEVKAYDARQRPLAVTGQRPRIVIDRGFKEK